MSETRRLAALTFVVDDLLAPHEHRALLEYAVQRWADLEPSLVNHPGRAGAIDPGYRRSALLLQPEGIWPIFEARLTQMLPQVRRVLGVPWFEVEWIERQLTAHGDGDFFRIHADNGGEDVRSRVVTFVYYFGSVAGGFTGGDLVVFDGDVGDDGFVHAGPPAQVLEPVDNRIVFFPSWAFHEVTPVRTLATGIAGHRLTVNGWYRARAGAELDRLARARGDAGDPPAGMPDSDLSVGGRLPASDDFGNLGE